MKKIYFLASAFAFIAGVSNAQVATRNGKIETISSKNPSVSVNSTRALGDTLFYFDGANFYITDAQDNTDFVLENQDLDGLTPNNSGAPTAFAFSYYSLNASDFLPGDVDTAWYIGATSWFNPAGTSDNWWGFGPITIPAGGADFSWYNHSNPGYTDGYKVFVSTTGAVPYTDVDPATATPIFTKATIVPPATQPAADTIWNQSSVTLTGYANERVYILFQHAVNDGDMIYLDQMVVTERNDVGVKSNEADFSVSQNMPNPAKNNTVINYSLASAKNVSFKLFDITGKEVLALNEGTKAAGKYSIRVNTNSLNSGIYYYTVTAGNNSVTKKMVILE